MAATAALLHATASLAASLASATLLAPLAPEQESRLSIPMPPQFTAGEEVWVAYELVALSPDDGDGDIGIEQSFEGVMTPATSLFTTFHAGKMQSTRSAGTIARRLEQIAGPRDREDLRRAMGAEMFAAYEAVNSGEGRMLTGRLIRRLPAPGTTDAPLLVSVERATGMQPVAVKVTVGQGPLPEQFQEKPRDALAYKVGYGLGLMGFGWLVMRFFRRRD